MRAKEVFEAAIKAKKMSIADVARILEVNACELGQKINIRESIKANDFFEILDAIGVGVVFFMKDTGAVLLNDGRRTKRVVGVSDGVKYDTGDATLIATSFFADGEHEYGEDGKAQELYVDREGRYFIAEYSSNENERSRVRSVPYNMATAFIKQYGIDIDDNKPV